MPFNVGETINNIAESFLRAPIVSVIMTNPIYTALLLVFVIMLVILFIFRTVDTTDAGESLLVLCMRGGVFIFMILLGTLFLHDRILSMEVSDNNKSKDYNDVFSGGFVAANRGEGFKDIIVPVEINTDFSRGPARRDIPTQEMILGAS